MRTIHNICKVLLFSTLIVFIASCGGSIPSRQQKSSPRCIRVKCIEAGGNGIGAHRNFVGETVPLKTVVLTAPYPGTLVSLPVSRGTLLQASQTVAVISSQSAISALEASKATLEQARDAYDRVQKVYSEGGVSELQMVEVRTKLSQAEASYRAALKSVEDCTVKAPYKAVVADTYSDCGVELSMGERIATLMDISTLQIRVWIHENDISSIRQGDRATVEIPALGLTGLGAVIKEKGLMPSTMAHSYECLLRLDSTPAGLMPGMSVKMRFDSQPDAAEIVIPAAAIQMDSHGKYVWLNDNGTVRKADITIGEFSGKGVVVREGLNAGDRVIVEGYQKVSSGMRVEE